MEICLYLHHVVGLSAFKKPTSHPSDVKIDISYLLNSRPVCSLLFKSDPAPFRTSYIKFVKANEIIFLDLSDVVVLEVNDHCFFSNLLRDSDLTCLWKSHIIVTLEETLLLKTNRNSSDISIKTCCFVPRQKVGKCQIWLNLLLNQIMRHVA